MDSQNPDASREKSFVGVLSSRSALGGEGLFPLAVGRRGIALCINRSDGRTTIAAIKAEGGPWEVEGRPHKVPEPPEIRDQPSVSRISEGGRHWRGSTHHTAHGFVNRRSHTASRTVRRFNGTFLFLFRL